MGDKRLKALVIFDDNRAQRGGAIRYFTNYRNTLKAQLSALVIPKVGDPVLIISPGVGDSQFFQAADMSWIRDVRGHSRPDWSPDFAKDVLDSLTQAGIEDGNVGVEGQEQVPAPLYRQFEETLAKYQLVNTGYLSHKVRLRHGVEELSSTRFAVRLAEFGLYKFLTGIKSGDSQSTPQTESEYVVKQLGAEDVECYFGAGKPWVWGAIRDQRRFSVGDMVGSEYNAVYNGYFGQTCRTAVLGKPTNEQKAAYDSVYNAYKSMVNALKPKTTAEDVFLAGVDQVTAAGFELGGRWGHGMGLSYAEGFNLGQGDKTMLEESFSVMVHPVVADSRKGIGCIIGDMYQITKTGAQRFGNLPYFASLDDWRKAEFAFAR